MSAFDRGGGRGEWGEERAEALRRLPRLIIKLRICFLRLLEQISPGEKYVGWSAGLVVGVGGGDELNMCCNTVFRLCRLLLFYLSV